MQLRFKCILNASNDIAFYISLQEINVFKMYLNLERVKPGF